MNRDRRGDVGRPGGGSATAAAPAAVPGKTTLTGALPPILSSTPKTKADAPLLAQANGATAAQRKLTHEGAVATDEAANTIQQRGGVQRKGGIDGGAGDPYERHADAVANAVVAGRSAEPLLDHVASGARGAAVVQRQQQPGSGPSQPGANAPTQTQRPSVDQGPQPASIYFADNQGKFFEAIRARLSSITLPPPHERLVWGTDGLHGIALERALVVAYGTDMTLALALRELLYPTDPFQLIDMHRDLGSGRPGERTDGQPALGPLAWNPVVGQAFALEIEACLRRSLPRMGLRYVAQADDYHGQLPSDQLVASEPFDRVVALLLCDPAVARFVPAHGKPGKRIDTTLPAAFKNGIRLVVFEWQGARDPKLWNWIRVSDPADARPEEVAASVFDRGDGQNHTEYAYALTAAPPYFRVPPDMARRFPAAAEHAPRGDAAEDAQSHSALDLAASPVGDDAARAQVGKPAAKLDIAALRDTLNRSAAQLRLANDRLAVWNLNYLVTSARQWVDRHQDAALAAPDETLKVWAAIAMAQAATLLDATGDLIEVLDLAASAHVVPGASEAMPFRDVIEAFGIAMGESHLAQSASAQLVAAKQQKARLPLTLLDRTMRESHDAAQELAATEHVPVNEADHVDPRAMAASTNRTLEASTVALREKAMATGAIDTTELETLTVAASEETLRTRLLTLHGKLGQLHDISDDAIAGFFGHVGNVRNSDIWKLREELVTLQPLVWEILDIMRKEAMPPQPIPKDPAQAQAAFAKSRKLAVAHAQASFAKLTTERQLESLFQRALGTVTDAQRNTAYFKLAVEIAALIGVSIAGGVAGSLVGGLVRGAILADAATDAAVFVRGATAARLIGGAADVATDAALQSAVQTGMFGGNTKLTFIENVMTNLMTLGALHPFHALTGEIGQLDKNAVGLWRIASGGKVVLVEGGKLTMETLVAAGAAYVSARLVEGQPPPSNDVAISWAMQGAAMAVGKFVHGRVRDVTERWAKLGEQKVQLLKRARVQEALAHAVEQSGTTEAALQLLEQHVQLLQDEHALLQDPAAVARLGLDAKQLATLRAGNDAALADTHSQSFEVMKLRFRGLQPAASNGLVWSGTREQIEAALAESGAAATQLRQGETGRWTAHIGGRELTFIEVEPIARTDERTPAPDRLPSFDASERQELVALGAMAHELSVLDKLVAAGPQATRRLIRTYEKDLIERLKTQPFSTLPELETALAKGRNEVKDRVAGLYEGTNAPPQGWQFSDVDGGVVVEHDGTRTLRTRVTGPNGATGYFERAYNPNTKELELRMAFLKMSGQEVALPNMVPKQSASTEMVPGRGTPTVQYVTLYQMRRLAVPMGHNGAGAVQKVHLSDIQNVETIVHLHYLRTTNGGDLSELVVHTASVKYAETTAIQSGYQRSDLPVLMGGQTTPIKEVLFFQERDSPQRRAENDAILKKYGFSRDTPMRWGFDIDFAVRPQQ